MGQGDFGVTASVYYPPLKRYFPSRRNLVKVRRAKVLWTRQFGVPQGNNRPIQFRKYSLLSYRDSNRSNLYVRVSTKDDARVLATYSLGRALVSYQPNVDIDANNRLNVLHLGGPQFYAHSIVGTDGSLIRQDYYKQVNGSTPALTNLSGSIARAWRCENRPPRYRRHATGLLRPVPPQQRSEPRPQRHRAPGRPAPALIL